MAELIKVSAHSRSTAVAGAIAGVMREEGYAEMQGIGASAVNQAIKAVAIARTYLEQDNIDLVIVPSFTEVEINGNERTAVRIAIYQRPASLIAKNYGEAGLAVKGNSDTVAGATNATNGAVNGTLPNPFVGVLNRSATTVTA